MARSLLSAARVGWRKRVERRYSAAMLAVPRADSPPRMYWIGADENGLGARLGPLIVTAVLSEVDVRGQRWLRRPLPASIAADLDDSKRLLSFGNHGLGEAWARALVPAAARPSNLLETLSEAPIETLQKRCPERSAAQCWSVDGEEFSCDPQALRRVQRHLRHFERQGVKILGVRSSIVCVGQLNAERRQGCNRFTSDLHAMERLLLLLRDAAGHDVVATCGKVGGIADYPRFFGPLSGRLHTVVQQERKHSAYRVAGLGELHFVQDADATNPLVMLASMIGKYARELLMGRISRYYSLQVPELERVSGYNDPKTDRFVRQTTNVRRTLKIAAGCFERE